MKKILLILFLLSGICLFSQTKQSVPNIRITKNSLYSYIFTIEKNITASEAKYIIEISRKELRLNRAFFDSKKQIFIIESYSNLKYEDICKIVNYKIIKFKLTNTSYYLRDLFGIKKDDKPKKLPKFYVK